VAILIAVIVGAIFLLAPTPPAVALPAYLDRCLGSPLLYHSHPSLQIIINGANIPIPAKVGISGGCLRNIHTHAADGVIHTETETNNDRDYTLGDFFLIWGNTFNDPKLAIFNSTQIFDNKVDATHSLTMTVNNSPVTSFQAYVIPRNAGTSTGGSSGCTPGPCQLYNIVITYGAATS